MISLILAEPKTFNYRKDYHCIDVIPKLMGEIARGAKIHEDEDGLAYSFGEVFDIDDYEHPGWIKVSERKGQVGFLEMAGARRKFANGYKSSDFEKEYGEMVSNNTSYLNTIKEHYPEIRWIAETYPGATEAHFHLHLDDKEQINSIIIDMGYFYKAKILSDEDDGDESSDSLIYEDEDSAYDSSCSCENCQKKGSRRRGEKEESHRPSEKDKSHRPSEKDKSHRPSEKEHSHRPSEKEHSHRPSHRNPTHRPSDKSRPNEKEERFGSLSSDTIV
jgi:hypothetical protein